MFNYEQYAYTINHLVSFIIIEYCNKKVHIYYHNKSVVTVDFNHDAVSACYCFLACTSKCSNFKDQRSAKRNERSKYYEKIYMASNSSLQFWVMGCIADEVYLPLTLEIVVGGTLIIIFNILACFCGTLANGLVITAYYRNSRLQTIQNTIFLLLAITDISVTALVQPAYAAAWIYDLIGKRRCYLWNIVSLSSMLLVYLSLLTMIILSLQSYITLAYPYSHQNIVTMRRLKVIWMLVFILIVFATFAENFHSRMRSYLSVCLISLTIFIVVSTWIWTYKLIARHRKSIQTTQTPSSSEIVSTKKTLRSTFTALAVILSLLFCYFFGLCFTLLKTLNVLRVSSYGRTLLLAATGTTLIYLNSLLNPCLVFWRQSSFRDEVKNVFY